MSEPEPDQDDETPDDRSGLERARELTLERAAMLEGITINEIIHDLFDGHPYGKGQVVKLFRTLESGNQIHRSATFRDGFRVYFDVRPSPALITNKNRLYHDLLDAVMGVETTPRLARLKRSMSDRHPNTTDLDIERFLLQLVQAGVLEDPPTPATSPFETTVGETPAAFTKLDSLASVIAEDPLHLPKVSAYAVKDWLEKDTAKAPAEAPRTPQVASPTPPTIPEPVPPESAPTASQEVKTDQKASGPDASAPSPTSPPPAPGVSTVMDAILTSLLPKAAQANRLSELGAILKDLGDSFSLLGASLIKLGDFTEKGAP